MRGCLGAAAEAGFLLRQAGEASGPYCRPMSILADSCVDMGGMSGCVNYKALCFNPRSVVQQCSDAPAVPRVLKTMSVRATAAACPAAWPQRRSDSCVLSLLGTAARPRPDCLVLRLRPVPGAPLVRSKSTFSSSR